jgi:hypothetical protein
MHADIENSNVSIISRSFKYMHYEMVKLFQVRVYFKVAIRQKTIS